MTDRITVVGPLIFPGNPGSTRGRTVLVRCIGPDGAVCLDGDGVPIGDRTIHTDPVDGSFAVEVTRNDVVDRASGFTGSPGSVWTFTIGTNPAVTWPFRVDAGTLDGASVPPYFESNSRWRPYGLSVLRVPTASLPPSTLEDRPVRGDFAGQFHRATNADPALSQWDGTVWDPVSVSASRTLAFVDTASPATVSHPGGGTPMVIPELTTTDEPHTGGPLRWTLSALFAGVDPATDLVDVAWSDDAGSTWHLIGVPVPLVQQSASFGGTFLPAPNVFVADVPAGTVRFAARVTCAAPSTVTVGVTSSLLIDLP